jgi:hypothetical protein
MGGTAEIASVGTAQSGEYQARLRDGNRQNLQAAFNQRVLIRHGDFRLAEKAPHESNSFFSTYMVTILLEGLIIQNGAIATQNDLARGRILAYQRRDLLHAVKCSHYEGDSDEIISFLEFSNQFPPSWVVKHYRRDFQVVRYVIERIMNVCGSRAENSLGPCDLPIEEFIADTFAVTVSRPEGPAYTGKKQFPVFLFVFMTMHQSISLSAALHG